MTPEEFKKLSDRLGLKRNFTKKELDKKVQEMRAQNAGKKLYLYDDEAEVYLKEGAVQALYDYYERTRNSKEQWQFVSAELKNKVTAPRKKGAEENKRKAQKNYDKFKSIISAHDIDIKNLKKSALEGEFKKHKLPLKESTLYIYKQRYLREKS